MVAVLFGALPLVASPAFFDQFASIKWYALEAMAIVFFVVELLGEGSHGWPAAAWRARWPLVLLFALPLPGALHFGLLWAAPALVERVTLLGLSLAFFWYFRRRAGDLRAVVAGLEIGVAGTCLVGIAQALGVQPFPSLTAGDQRSALFGNVNMAAEFLGFAILALVAAAPRPGRRGLAREALVAYALVLLFLLASRSSFLGVLAGAVALWGAGRLSMGRLGRLAAASATAAVVLVVGSWAMGSSGEAQHLLRAEVQQHKRDSSSLRFAAWDGTLALVRDHPGGIGLGNFPDVFIPYQLESAAVPSESLYFRSPHDEVLRLAAEGGWAAVALALVLGSLLVRALWTTPRLDRGRSESGVLLVAGGVFYGVEAVFQFPLDVAMGGLALSMLLGLALFVMEPAPVVAAGSGALDGGRGLARAAWPLVGIAAATCVGIAAGRIARSEWLYVAAPRDRAAQEEACRQNPRNLPACVTAAWLQGRARTDGAADDTLRTVLTRSPYYFPAIKLRGEQALARGNAETACRSLWIYDELFRRRSTVHRFLGRYCEPEQFERYRDTIPIPHYGVFPFDP